MIEIRNLLGLLLLITQAVIAFPIIVSLLKAKTRKGFSVTGEAIWVIAATGWIFYGVFNDSITLILSGILAASTSLTITLLAWRDNKEEHKTSIILSSIAAISFILSTIFFGPIGLSIALSIFGVVQFLPQFTKTLKQFKTPLTIEGVSIIGVTGRSLYTLGWSVYAGAWMLWGLTTAQIDWPLFTWGIMGTVTFASQIVLVLKNAKTPPRTQPLTVQSVN